MNLNLASFVPETTVLGPGIRSVIWVQGCPFHCPGCIAPEWIENKPAKIINIDIMAQKILANEQVTGLTVSGGEPMIQAAALSQLIKLMRRKKDLDVICYTGFKYEDLAKKKSPPDIQEFLSQIDLLIDGPYVAKLNDNVGMRGSSNQRFHFLTDKIRYEEFEATPRKIEFFITEESLMLVGIPDQSSLKVFDSLMENLV